MEGCEGNIYAPQYMWRRSLSLKLHTSSVFYKIKFSWGGPKSSHKQETSKNIKESSHDSQTKLPGCTGTHMSDVCIIRER